MLDGSRVATNLENWNTQGFLWTRKTHGILREFCTTLGKTDFVIWVQPASSNSYAAKCIWCTKTVDLSNMERQALVSHMSSSWCGMTLDIRRSLLRIPFVAITSGKVQLWLLKSLENSGNFSSPTLWTAWVAVVVSVKHLTCDDATADCVAAGSETSCDSRMLDACTEYFEPSTVFISSSKASTSWQRQINAVCLFL